MISFAHAGDISTGPQFEFLIVAGAALVIAVTLFVRKTAPPSAPIVLTLIAIALGVGAFTINRAPAAGETRVTIIEPKPGDEVEAGEELDLQVAVHDEPEGSHIHVFVDGALADMPSGLEATVTLPRGRHEVMVELTASDHSGYEPRVTDTIELIAR